MTNTDQAAQAEISNNQEEAARADMYGFLAGLYFRAPQAALLNAIADSATQADSLLGEAWSMLADACRDMNATKIQEEFDKLFIGVGKPEILLYGSYYLSGFLMEKPLAELRNDLASLGLERPEHIAESEDHISCLFEVMRILIADESEGGTLSKQKQFYASHIHPWIDEMCAAIMNHPNAHFYKNVANLTKCFAEVESQAFEMN